MNEMSAAVASVQLNKLDMMLDKACVVKDTIKTALKKYCDEIQFRTIPDHSTENFDSI